MHSAPIKIMEDQVSHPHKITGTI